jgi:hypothetical protein
MALWWTWLVIAACAQLRLARNLAASPAPALAAPGPRRPPGSKNFRPAARHDVGKNHKETTPKKNAVRQTVPVPVPVPGPGQVLVRIEVCGLCHTTSRICSGSVNYVTTAAFIAFTPNLAWPHCHALCR